MRSAVVIFPGSNCDQDVLRALREHTRGVVEPVWHANENLPKDTDLVVLPGGFSYGDYLRPGAMAARSPIMKAVKEHAARGRYVLGICNGFQVLTEAHLLPGALLPNKSLSFICRPCHVRVETTGSPFTSRYSRHKVLQFPIAHHEGLYFLPDKELEELEKNGQIIFRYVDSRGALSEESNPNGSKDNIAGIANAERNVLGLMPHPERASDPALGGIDGIGMWHSIQSWIEEKGRK
ncbi:MAG TPA: phosphoribosylformylglycinamidine synthase subunit PurQ [Synergistaceae bacterium]|nr:phosphoribosylformylglycinamidine synthase subunit PurQ [Synergistaceae bacterium]HPQ36830.1 phosphoribosylformylglycinamidine synthase subunit PurQ [Synergistaceae bacterium]